MVQKIDIAYFFRDKNRFPWEYAGLDFPVYGEAHSYLSKYLARFEPEQESFLLGNPSMSELKKVGSALGGLSKRIWDHCQNANEMGTYRYSQSLQDQILDFLKDFSPFRSLFEKSLTTDHKLGRITIPESAIFESSYEY